MKKIFISYRHAEPDKSLAQVVTAQFRSEGFDVFIDEDIEIGQRWAERIENEIRDSNAFVVLLSEHSVVRDMVRKEVQIAYELYQRDKARDDLDDVDRFQILPVRVEYEEELPYDLGGWLDAIQYAFWQRSVPAEALARQLAGALKGADLEQHPVKPREIDQAGRPQPVADIVMETGALLDSPFYVKRSVDDDAMRSALGDGTTTVIRGPRQMGKSSLLAQIYSALAERGGELVSLIDLQIPDASRFETIEVLCKYLAARIARDLPGAARPKDLWDDYIGPTENLTDYIESQALAADTRFTLLLDEVDKVAEYPYFADFFSMLRGWHDRRATRVPWRRFNIVIAHSTDPNAWIANDYRSPFNVGTRTTLPDFDETELADLVTRYQAPLLSDDLKTFRELLGGHPFLSRVGLYELTAGERSFAQLRASATEEDGPFADHMKHYFFKLKEHPSLVDGLKSVIHNRSIADTAAFTRLHAAGLITGESPGASKMRCELYREYFRTRL